MYTTDPAVEPAASSLVSALAENLCNGPLEAIADLQRRAQQLAEGANDADCLDDLEELVALSLAAMERFHAFTGECEAAMRLVAAAAASSH